MANPINLHRSFSAVNQALASVFDQNVKRSFTVPYIHGQATDEHVRAVGKSAAPNGGLTKNLVTSAHHADGRGYGSGDGETVGHPTHQLRQVEIRKNDPHVKKVLDAAQNHLSNIAKLVGKNNPAVKTAQSQLDIIAHNDAVGMTLYDLGVGIQNLLTPPLQAVSRAHHAAENGGPAIAQNEMDAMNEPRAEEESTQQPTQQSTQQPTQQS